MTREEAEGEEPDPREDPEGFIRHRFEGRRDHVEAVADLGLGELSEDAEKVLAILDEEE